MGGPYQCLGTMKTTIEIADPLLQAARKVARRERDIQALGMNIHSDRRKREQRKTADAARSQAEQRNK